MRRPGKGDTLIKIASLGGGGVAIGGHLQKTANKEKKNRKDIEKAKQDDAAYRAKIRRIKMKYKNKQKSEKDLGNLSDEEIRRRNIDPADVRMARRKKAIAKKMLEKSKCKKCGGKGCSYCKGK